jgi:hypothetical protein
MRLFIFVGLFIIICFGFMIYFVIRVSRRSKKQSIERYTHGADMKDEKVLATYENVPIQIRATIMPTMMKANAKIIVVTNKGIGVGGTGIGIRGGEASYKFFYNKIPAHRILNLLNPFKKFINVKLKEFYLEEKKLVIKSVLSTVKISLPDAKKIYNIIKKHNKATTPIPSTPSKPQASSGTTKH